jgi:anti-anti-sigma regulatory factor
METRIVLVEEIGPYLTRAGAATRLCENVLSEWCRGNVLLDFTGVLRISPSFANALFLNLIHAGDRDGTRCRVLGTLPHVQAAIDKVQAAGIHHRRQLTSYLPVQNTSDFSAPRPVL